jgi:hypothetical protein
MRHQRKRTFNAQAFIELALAVGTSLYAGQAGGSLDTPHTLTTIQIVLAHRDAPNKVTPAGGVRPGPAEHLFFSYTDCDFEYECYCRHRFSYRLQEVDTNTASALRDKLQSLEQSPMFGCYQTGMDLRGRKEVRCRFVRRLELARDDKAFAELPVPKDAGSHLTVWFESAIRVDAKGLPLEEACPRALPVLVAARGKSYQVLQERQAGGQRCIMEPHFDGMIFDLSACKDDVSCMHKALDAYSSSVIQELSGQPVGASEIHDQPKPPGEIWMRRDHERSEILGSPYFELSTYVLKLWFAGGDHGDFSLKPREDLHALYMNASQTFTCSVGINGQYKEPELKDIAAFKAATTAALNRALKSACNNIHGHIVGSLCKL